MSDDLKKGEHVNWQSHGGTAEGVVEEKITSDTDAAGRTSARASRARARTRRTGGPTRGAHRRHSGRASFRTA
jgi:Hypervirulence associated proteins TUDOR domain